MTVGFATKVSTAQDSGIGPTGVRQPAWFEEKDSEVTPPLALSTNKSGRIPQRIDWDELTESYVGSDCSVPQALIASEFQQSSSYYQAALSSGDYIAANPGGYGSGIGSQTPAYSIDDNMESFRSTGSMGFSPPPTLWEATWKTYDSAEQVYDSKKDVPTERPWVEWGRGFYAPGMIAPGGRLFSDYNLLHPTFYVYGDYRVGIGSGKNAKGRFDNLAQRLNLDLDLALTATERFHGFIGPFNNAGNFTQFRLENEEVVFDPQLNANFVTGFFEGDLGYMLGGLHDEPAQFELPIAIGLMPLLYQNGIWMEDAVTGFAISRNAQHNNLLNWSNYDASVFAIFDQLNSPVFGTDNHAAQAIGTAWFIEAYGGYIETGFAYVHDRKDQGRSYNNATISYTRRYFDRIGNSVRVILNSGQNLPGNARTADGGLLILENNWITANPLTLVPYMNLFYGWGTPQSVARNGLAGGILRNVGINFETDGLNGYPTLDDSGNNTVGGAAGVNLLGANLNRQLILEGAVVHGYGSDSLRRSAGNEYGLGMRYQMPLSNCTLVRFDTMYGWREGVDDLYGARAEFRYKF